MTPLTREAIAARLVAMGFDPGDVEATVAACFGPCVHANYRLGHCPEIARAARPSEASSIRPPEDAPERSTEDACGTRENGR